MEETRSAVGDLLFEHHLIYQHLKKRVVTQKEFAEEYIGMDDQKYNHIYKGKRKANLETIRMLAEFFDDIRFYEAAGYDPPDPRLHLVQSTWRDLPSGITKQIADIVSEYKTKKK